MEIEFDPAKDEANQSKHGISLSAVAEMDFTEAEVVADVRVDYGEERFLDYAPLRGRLHVLYFTMRGDVMRPIGLRKANKRERDRFEASS
jgi:uncharacterized DUF497 family protein